MASQSYTFDQADSTTLPAGLNESVGDSQTVTNKLRPVTSGSNVFVTISTALSGADQYADADVDFVSLPTSGVVVAGVTARSDSTAANCYNAYITKDSVGAYAAVIAKRVASANTVLTTTAVTPTLPAAIRFEVVGTSLVMKVNGTTVHSITDTAVTTGNYAGTRQLAQSSTRTVTLDNLTVQDAGGSAGTFVTTAGDATAEGASGTFTGAASFATDATDAAADGSSGSMTGAAVFATTAGDATADGDTTSFTATAVFVTTAGDATADGGVTSFTAVTVTVVPARILAAHSRLATITAATARTEGIQHATARIHELTGAAR